MARTWRVARALRHRNYRLFFLGQGTSQIGTWLSKFATSWMAYRLTGSPFMLGLVTFFNNAPTPLIAPFAGVFVDRRNRHRVIVATQCAAAVQSATLAAFAFTGTMTVWHLMWLGAAQGVINAFDMPARQSFLREMIDDPTDLPNAIALNSSMVNSAKLIGPAIAAVLVGLVGEAWCFAIDAASYLAVIGSLLAMTVTPRPMTPRTGRVIADIVDGVRYAASVPIVRSVLILLAVTSVLGGAYTTLLPVIAGEHLHGGPGTLGVLMTAAGLGALSGALYLASRSTIVGLGRVIGITVLGLGAGMIVLELATATWIAATMLYVVGASLMIQMAATNTIVQTVTPPDKLGRVMSLYLVAFTGGIPLGSLIEGSLASHIGAIHTFAIAGVVCLASGIWFMRSLPELRAQTRPLYVELGILEHH
ncbi:MAG TPA: MFS transporter [Kofleriaceae bacterium]|nr:MFS transporter [Kofleriaceae bacterium]